MPWIARICRLVGAEPRGDKERARARRTRKGLLGPQGKAALRVQELLNRWTVPVAWLDWYEMVGWCNASRVQVVALRLVFSIVVRGASVGLALVWWTGTCQRLR